MIRLNGLNFLCIPQNTTLILFIKGDVTFDAMLHRWYGNAGFLSKVGFIDSRWSVTCLSNFLKEKNFSVPPQAGQARLK